LLKILGSLGSREEKECIPAIVTLAGVELQNIICERGKMGCRGVRDVLVGALSENLRENCGLNKGSLTCRDLFVDRGKVYRPFEEGP